MVEVKSLRAAVALEETTVSCKGLDVQLQLLKWQPLKHRKLRYGIGVRTGQRLQVFGAADGLQYIAVAYRAYRMIKVYLQICHPGKVADVAARMEDCLLAVDPHRKNRQGDGGSTAPSGVVRLRKELGEQTYFAIRDQTVGMMPDYVRRLAMKG